jgi:hypothetical protein
LPNKRPDGNDLTERFGVQLVPHQWEQWQSKLLGNISPEYWVQMSGALIAPR